MATETTWDGGATTWDRDYAGPGTRTVWDLLPDDLKIDELAVVAASAWKCAAQPAGWLAETLPPRIVEVKRT